MLESEFNETNYQKYLEAHRLMASRCSSCGALHLPPRPLCPECYSVELAWQEVSTRGRLEAFTSVYIAPSAMIDAGYGRQNPYCVGVVRLDDGPAVSAQLMGIDPARPEEITIGSTLEASFIERGEGEEKKTYLVFQQR